MTSTRYPLFLASVRTAAEARLCACADVIDCKEPREGALGALPHTVVCAIRADVRLGQLVSATVGDLVPEPERVVEAVNAMAATGVDYVKLGIFPGGAPADTIRALAPGSPHKARLVGLLLADRDPDFSLIDVMAKAGFAGVMLDTVDKGRGALPEVMSLSRLQRFIETAKGAGLFAGLAGSLRINHIAPLLTLNADILGFRGALCRVHDRSGGIDPDAIQAVREAIPHVTNSTAALEKVLS